MGQAAPEEFVAFVAATSGGLLRAACLLDPEYAEDLVQDTYVRVAAHWSRLDPVTAPAYARRVLYHRAVDSWRSAARRRERPSDALPERAIHAGTSAHDDRVVLQQALATLPPRQRAVVILRYFEDLTEAETAGVLECSISTVKTHHRRALSALRALAPMLVADDVGEQRPRPDVPSPRAGSRAATVRSLP